MKTLGIIGGIAPPSTIDYYRQLTSLYRARSPDAGAPSILIDSIDFKRFLELLVADDRPELIEFLLRELDRLSRGGADFGLFASNSPHLVYDQVAHRSPIPLISIVEETALVARDRGFRKLGLLGARFTMEGGFYPEVFARHGMTVVVPEPNDRACTHDRYLAELAEGVYRDETRAEMSAIIDRMKAKDDIDAVILGGTELPLLFRDQAPAPVPQLDTTTIHVESALARMLA